MSGKGPPKHQNEFAINPTEVGGQIRPYSAITGVCARCKEQIDWIRRYGKYKPLSEPAKCQRCSKRNVRQAYHNLCAGCAKEHHVCAKCSCRVDKIIGRDLLEVEAEQKTLEEAIKNARERDRRSLLRAPDIGSQCTLTVNRISETREEVSGGLKVMGARSTENLSKGSLSFENQESKDEDPSMDKGKINAEPVNDFKKAGKRKKKRKSNRKPIIVSEFGVNSGGTKFSVPLSTDHPNLTIENPKVQDEIKSIDQAQINTPMQDLAERNVIVNIKKKRKRTKKAKFKRELSSRMDAEPTENLVEVDVKNRLSETRDEVSGGLKVMGASSTENLSKGSLTFENQENKDEDPSMDKVKINAEPVNDFTKAGKRKKKRKSNGEPIIVSEFGVNSGGTKFSVPLSADHPNLTIKNPKVQDEIQSIDQAQINTPMPNLAERNVIANIKKKRKRTKKAKVKREFSIRMDAESTENLVEVDVKNRISETRDEVSGGLKVMGAGSTENLSEGSLTFENQKYKDEDPGSTENLSEGSLTFENQKYKVDDPSTDKVKIYTEPVKGFTKAGKRKRKRKNKRKPSIVSEFHANSGGTKFRMPLSTGHAEVSCHKMAPIVSVRRKLLVLDINGLLADVVFPAPKDCKADIKLYGRAVFRRPFCDDFLKFCFQNFYVGIWSSRSKKVVDKVVSYLLGDQEDKLIFCWDMAHTTQTGFNTLENRHKPLVCKELRKIWEEDDPSWPWKMGDFNESNTLLLDDSPYKALLNPLHTSISPHPYQYSDKNDNSLGPGGDLRVYLEGLAASENVQEYVKQHPFGQGPITEQHLRWEFYDRVLKRIQSVQQ